MNSRRPHAPAEAMTAIVQRYRPRLVARARGILRSDDLAQDAVQEVFVRAWREPRFFDETFRQGAWLYRVTTNLCYNRSRDHRRRQDILAQRPPKEPAPPDQAERVLDAQRAAVVDEALNALSADHRTILQHRYLHDLSYKEIASALGLKIGTVMSRLARAKTALAHQLSNHPIVEP